MQAGARRLAVRKQCRPARRVQRLVRMALAVLVSVTAVGPAFAQHITAARYTEPTTRYAHGVLGDVIEHGALELTLDNGVAPITLRLPLERVFEDTAPRVVDVDGDGRAEVVVVESHQDQGARLAIYNTAGLVAATPYIGQRNRWLAPVAVADLDGDGLVELAYIDRPHLAKILRVWRFEAGALTEVATAPDLTNHRIGERDIAGGVRICSTGPEMIVARGDWSKLIAVTFNGTSLSLREIGPHEGRTSFARAFACD